MSPWTVSVAVHVAAAWAAWSTLRGLPVMSAGGAIGRQVSLEMSLDSSMSDISQQVEVEVTAMTEDAKAAEQTREIEPIAVDSERLQTAFAPRPDRLDAPQLVESPVSPTPAESQADRSRQAVAPTVARAMTPRRRSVNSDAMRTVVNKPVVASSVVAARRGNAGVSEAAHDQAGTSGLLGIPNADEVDQPPREPAGNAEPAYPALEKRSRIEGLVVLRLLIDESGAVIEAKIVSGRPAFCSAVLAVVKSWRFEPARHGGRAVKVWGVKEVSFTHARNRR